MESAEHKHKVSDLLTDETKWTKGTFARNQFGYVVKPNSPMAVCFCLAGAINRCYPLIEANEILNKIAEYTKMDNIATWNDAPERTFEEVRALVTKLDI